jgi:ATP-dependent RNA helicase DDX10/DBP4
MRWTPELGLGAIIISPTRELAMQVCGWRRGVVVSECVSERLLPSPVQIFDVLKLILANHMFTAGLLLGGKPFADEQKYLLGLNILVCTPGRLLQHMEQTYAFDCSQIVVRCDGCKAACSPPATQPNRDVWLTDAGVG